MNPVAKRVSSGVARLDAILAVESQFARGAKGDPGVAVRVFREALQGEDWPPSVRALAGGATSLFRWLRSVAQTDEARQVLVEAEIELDDLSGWEPRLELRVTEQGLAPGFDDDWHGIPDCLRGKMRRIADVEVEGRALDVAVELLVEPPPAAPSPSLKLFKSLWGGRTVREASRELDLQGRTVIGVESDSEGLSLAGEEIEKVVPDDDAAALVVWTYKGRASIIANRDVRRHWLELVMCGSMSDALVFAPDAAWLICYFHHDYLDVAQRVEKWRHRVTLPTMDCNAQ